MNREPNPARESTLRVRYFDELVHYLENLDVPGRPCGLLPPGSSQRQVLPYLDPPDVLQLQAIHAIGSRGFLISAGPQDPECCLQALDTRQMPVGRHRIYACLNWEKVPCGDLVEEPGNQGHPSPGRARWFRKSRVVLAANGDRLQHRDWLPVAEIERERVAGSIRTRLDPHFHPPVVNMRAYCHRNPLSLLAERALLRLERAAAGGGQVLLRIELQLLQNIAQTATAETAFLQAQRCVWLLRAASGDRPPLRLDGELESYRFSPEDFPVFLAKLAACLDGNVDPALYPATLEINDSRYQKLGGELLEDGDFWSWTPESPGFVLNGLVIYMPWVKQGELPNIRYGRLKTEPHRFDMSTFAKPGSAPGVCVVLENVKNSVGQLFLTADSATFKQRLRICLGEGHALYYR